MTGKGIFERAMALLGYDSVNGISGENVFLRRAPELINQIYADLHFLYTDAEFIPLRGLEEEIKLPARALCNILPYGVAMLLAQSENDGDKQQLFAQLYEVRRASMRHSQRVKDVLPRTEGCV